MSPHRNPLAVFGDDFLQLFGRKIVTELGGHLDKFPSIGNLLKLVAQFHLVRRIA
jgi:hypothetical protein